MTAVRIAFSLESYGEAFIIYFHSNQEKEGIMNVFIQSKVAGR